VGRRELLRLELAVFVAGAALMSLEIVGARILAPVFGTSIYVWGSLITVFLASLALGAALGGKLSDKKPRPSVLAQLLTVSGILTWVVFYAPGPMLRLFAEADVPDRFRSLLAALVLFAGPCTLMGTVTTFAVRLAAREIATIGAAAGRVSAVSTVGSIAGTFATTFLLIPIVSTPPILFGIGLSLVAAAWLVPAPVSPGRALRDLLLAGAASAVTFLAPGSASAPVLGGTLLLEKETAYHRIRVVEQGTRRVLYFDRFVQGYFPRNEGAEIPPNYSDALLLSLAFPRRPESLVAIGLGAGMIQAILSARAPEIAVTTLEIDPEVVAVARRFGVAPGAGSRILVGDGRRELLREISGTDVILVDAYFADGVPFHLLTKEFFTLARDRLSPDGVLAANFVGTFTGKGNALFWAAVRTLLEVFPRVYIFSGELARGEAVFRGNTIVVASRSSDRLGRQEIADRAAALAGRLGRASVGSWAASLYDGEMRTAGAPILTDDYSPTDALQHFRR
jgi:spermidine synthase